MKRVLSIILSILIVISIVPPITGNAATYTYNPDAAITYAKAHYNDGKGLCAEFVSDCLKAGGFTAVYNVRARDLGRQLQGYGTKITCSGWSSSSCLKASMFNGTLSKGDVIVWENASGSSSTGHVMLYSGKTNSKGQILVYAHNSAKNEEVIKPSSSASTVYAIHLTSTTENNYTYSFNFNANGGTLGTSGAFSVKYGEQFQILNTTCTRSGYTWGGWNVKRNNDNKWYVDGQGWRSESEISSNGYIKKLYPNYKTVTLDNSWTGGITGNGSYTFYAVWYKTRDSKVKAFFSPYGKGSDHITAMNASSSSGYAQNYVYAWYVLYDENTGDLLNTYTDLNYNVCMRITKPNGESYEDTNYQNADANWVGFTPVMSGEYTITITVTGGASGSYSTTYNVSYDTELIASTNSVSLNLNGTNTKTVEFTPSGYYPGSKGYTANLDSSIASVTEHYWSGEKFYFTIKGNKVGESPLTVKLYENYTGNKNVVATITIPVKVTANTYIISYDANGGSGAPPSQTKYYGTNITLSSTVPVRSGYTFLGWSTSSTATSATYQPGSTFSLNANTTLYAVWKVQSYSLLFDANGGDTAPSAMTGSISYSIPTTVPTRFGYLFLGWSKSSSATTATYVAGNTITLTDNTTLYAVWTQVNLSPPTAPTVSIIDGGQVYYCKFTPTKSGAYVVYSDSPYDTKVHLYNANGTEIANNDDGGEGQNFLLKCNLTAGTTYYFGVRYYSSSEIGTFYFKLGDVYEIKYDANGGLGAPLSQEKNYDIQLVLSNTVPIRTGYTFLGWSTSSTATTATYQPGDTFKGLANTTLYAVWKANTYTVRYNSNGGSGSMSNSTHTYDLSKALTSNGFTKSGYTFLGWSTNSSATTATYTNCQSVKNLTSTNGAIVDLYAVWSRIPTYTISYNANGGSGAPTDQTKTKDVTLTLSSTIPTKTGYTFKGWSTTSSATTASYQPGAIYTSNIDTTLYAVWQANTYIVRYNSNGGSGTMSNSTHTYDTSKVLSSNGFTRSGYTFLGWSTNSSATTATYTNCQSVKNLTSTNGATVELYAVWSKIPTYTISYNTNGGTGAPTDQTKTKDVSLTLNSTVPTRTGYTFKGWATTNFATIATYQPGGTFTTNADTTLYAVWQANTYTVTYNSNGGTGAMSNSTHTYDVSKALSSNGFTRSGYTFLGWATSSTATTATYTNSQSVKNLTSTNGATVDLYAVWQLDDPDILLGDVNGDGSVDAGDAGLISRYDAGLITLTATQLEAGDVNGDGVVDAGDAGLISRYDAGLISSLG